MITLLLASVLTCADGAWILDGLVTAGGLTQAERSEIKIEIIRVMPDDCSPEQYNPDGSERS